jgi:hypothetical protein
MGELAWQTPPSVEGWGSVYMAADGSVVASRTALIGLDLTRFSSEGQVLWSHVYGTFYEAYPRIKGDDAGRVFALVAGSEPVLLALDALGEYAWEADPGLDRESIWSARFSTDGSGDVILANPYPYRVRRFAAGGGVKWSLELPEDTEALGISISPGGERLFVARVGLLEVERGLFPQAYVAEIGL